MQLQGGLMDAPSSRLHTRHASSSWLGQPCQRRSTCRRMSKQNSNSDNSPADSEGGIEFSDPEAKYKRYGKFFGGGYKLNADWLKDAPQVRIRNAAESRKLDELVELAVLNERLAGNPPPWEARSKLEYLKMRRKNWELVYKYVTQKDVVATLDVIEAAYIKAEKTLSEESRERNSIGQLKEQLVALQDEVAQAQQKLQNTQSRVEQNLSRINELRSQAVALENMRAATESMAAATDAGPSTMTSGQASTSYSQEPVRARAATARQRRNIGLKSSMEIEQQLKNFWFPAEFSSRLPKDTMVPFEIFNESWVMFRDEAGKPACIRDSCAHRACPLSLGKMDKGQVVCAYHGWQFNGEGKCTKMPSTVHCRNVGVTSLPCVEKDGFIWIWPGTELPTEVPDYTRPPAGHEIHAEIMVDVPVEHGLLMENLLDLAHAPFTHVSTFARGWPVPEAVKFHASKLLSGNWDPYPINMAFQPPCMVLSHIGLAQPGKIMRGVTADKCEKHLHQLHICLPSKRGHTRLLYRMSLDFMPWLRHVPFIDRVWKAVAGQVLGEDLVLVLGQQDRLQRGEDTWNFPVSYDKLAVRYRRWRNSVAAGDTSEAARLAASPFTSMGAGELFSVSDEDDDMGMETEPLILSELPVQKAEETRKTAARV